MKKLKLLPILLALTLVLNTSLTVKAEEEIDEEKLKLSIEEAVKLGLENNISLRQVDNEIELSALKQDRTEHLAERMEDAEESIDDGRTLINQKEQELNQAQSALDSGYLPKDVQLPDGTVVSAGTPTSALGAYEESVVDSVQDELDSNQEELNSKKNKLESGQSSLIDSLQVAGTDISGKLNFDSLDSFNVNATTDLMTTMANVSYEVTEASRDIYENQIALLIQKSYYDVLKLEKLLEVKRKAMKRGKKQYEFAKDSYEEGMKAKDDMLLAEVYYRGTQIDYNKTQGELDNAYTELKKNLNIPLDKEIVLTDVLVDENEIVDLEEGLESGLKNRLEMKKSLGEVVVYDLNLEKTKSKYPENTYQYKEAKLLKEKARINYDKTALNVESSIRQSYRTLMSTGEMLETSKEMIEKAKESLEIAEYKYKEGFGVETSLLKSLNLESSAGTIVEVLAAEENLAKVEEKVIEILHGYNLAKMKYYNDIGKLIY